MAVGVETHPWDCCDIWCGMAGTRTAGGDNPWHDLGHDFAWLSIRVVAMVSTNRDSAQYELNKMGKIKGMVFILGFRRANALHSPTDYY